VIAMNIIQEIETKLQKYPDVKFERQKNGLTIFPRGKTGFVVSLVIDDCYEVNFDGWHEEFINPEEALDCLAFGLSSKCRLRVFSRGHYDYKWTLEHLGEKGWEEESTTSLFFYPFWKMKNERYLQNDVID